MLLAGTIGILGLTGCLAHGSRATVVFTTRTERVWHDFGQRKAELRSKLAADIRLVEYPFDEGWSFAGKKGGEFEGLGVLWMPDPALKHIEIVVQCRYEKRDSPAVHSLTQLIESLIGASDMREIEVSVNSSPFA